MNRILLVVLFVLAAIAVAVIGGTVSDLPARMATHFGAGGEANGWSSRETYVAVMIAIVIGVPLLLLAVIAWLPRVGMCVGKLPNREYWLAPQRRERTFERLTVFATILGCLLVVFLTTVHLIVVEANTSPRPALPTAPFVAIMVGFAVAMVAWTIAFRYGFRRPV
jgi:uncharacterized membrane protein